MIRSQIPQRQIITRIPQVRKRMRKRPRARPRHGKHKMHGDTKRLRTVNMTKTRRIRNNSIRHKRRPRVWIWLNARLPAAVQDLCNSSAFPLDIACAQALHTGDKAWITYHVGHQLNWVSANRVKLETGIGKELLEDSMCCQSYAVAEFL